MDVDNVFEYIYQGTYTVFIILIQLILKLVKMQEIEEMKILLGNKGRYSNYNKNDIFLNITFKYRQLSWIECIVFAKYYLTYFDNNIKYWVI